MSSTAVRVLAVDDEPSVLDAYRKVFKGREVGADTMELMRSRLFGNEPAPDDAHVDVDLECAENAEDAVSRVRDACERGTPFAVVFMDVRMPPGRDGIWAAEQIRAIDPHIEIVIVTAFSDADPASIASRLQPVDKLLYVQKPFHPHEITHCAAALGAKWRSERELKRGHARLHAAQRIASFGYFEWNPETNSVLWSREMAELFGLPVDDAGGTLESVRERVGADSRGEFDAAFALKVEEGARSIELQVQGEDRTWRTALLEMSRSASAGVGGQETVICATLDITRRKAMEEQVRQLAYFDHLTGLPNRTYLDTCISQAIGKAERMQHGLGVLYLDLDHFKAVNDTHGHAAGDMLLCEVARRLGLLIRAGDVVAHVPQHESLPADLLSGGDTIVRLGGDEFIILLTSVERAHDPGRVAQRVVDSLGRPIDIGEGEVTVGVSIGIALYPDDGRDAQALLKSADSAMYHAKEMGRNGFQFYQAEVNTAAMERIFAENALLEAVTQNRLTTHLQPVLCLATNEMTRAEALARWTPADRAVVPPDEFIPLAEATGVINALGEQVFAGACSALAGWYARGSNPRAVSVNLSRYQLRDPELPRRLAQIALEHGVAPSDVELEFTEAVLAEADAGDIGVLHALRDQGFPVTLDDFGKGPSSLTALRTLPLNHVKLHHELVSQLTVDAGVATIVEAVITVARSIGLKVTAVGVESEEQMQLLKDMSCDFVQGFAVSAARDPDDFESRYLQRAEWKPPHLRTVQDSAD